jgi:hypothetical protein
MQTFEMITYANNQGDQIGLIFAYWAIVYVHKAFYGNYRSSPHFWATFFPCSVFTSANVLRYILGDF